MLSSSSDRGKVNSRGFSKLFVDGLPLAKSEPPLWVYMGELSSEPPERAAAALAAILCAFANRGLLSTDLDFSVFKRIKFFDDVGATGEAAMDACILCKNPSSFNKICKAKWLVNERKCKK